MDADVYNDFKPNPIKLFKSFLLGEDMVMTCLQHNGNLYYHEAILPGRDLIYTGQ